MNSELNQIEKSKEIADILADYNKLAILLSENDEVGMQELMEQIGEKHFVEKALFNLGAVNYPETIRENARNCIDFLKRLLLSKEFDVDR